MRLPLLFLPMLLAGCATTSLPVALPSPTPTAVVVTTAAVSAGEGMFVNALADACTNTPPTDIDMVAEQDVVVLAQSGIRTNTIQVLALALAVADRAPSPAFSSCAADLDTAVAILRADPNGAVPPPPTAP